MSVTTALLRIIYPPQYIGRGMSINAMVVAVSIAAGPSLAGAILSVASWNWLFAIKRTFRDLRDYNGLFSFASKSLQGWAETKV